MVTHSPDLYKNRSATHEFLFSHSQGPLETDLAAQARFDEDEAGSTALAAEFSELRDRDGLTRVVADTMASARALVAIAVRIVWPPDIPADGDRAATFLKKWLNPIADACRGHNGAWARTGRHRFVGVFPGLDADGGQALAQKLLEVFGDDAYPPVILGVADLATADGQAPQVIANAEKALAHGGFFGPGTITPFDAVSLNISGDRHYQAGDIAGAIAEYQKGLQLDPTDANLYNSLGVCFGVLTRHDKALAAFEKAIRLDPQDVMAIYNKGYIHLLKHQHESALDCFQRAARLEPDVFEVNFHIGLTFMEQQMPEKARPYLEAATRGNRHSGHAFKSLGRCLGRLGLTREAIQAYKRAVKVNPADAESLSMLGRLYTRLGESLDVAEVFCQQSVSLSPDNGLFHHRLGVVYLQQGKPDQARFAFARAIELGHDSHSDMQSAQAHLAAVKAS